MVYKALRSTKNQGA